MFARGAKMSLYILTFSCILQSLYAGRALDDDQWHTVHIRRRARNVQLAVDKEKPVKGNHRNHHKICRFSILFL